MSVFFVFLCVCGFWCISPAQGLRRSRTPPFLPMRPPLPLPFTRVATSDLIEQKMSSRRLCRRFLLSLGSARCHHGIPHTRLKVVHACFGRGDAAVRARTAARSIASMSLNRSPSSFSPFSTRPHSPSPPPEHRPITRFRLTAMGAERWEGEMERGEGGSASARTCYTRTERSSSSRPDSVPATTTCGLDGCAETLDTTSSARTGTVFSTSKKKECRYKMHDV